MWVNTAVGKDSESASTLTSGPLCAVAQVCDDHIKKLCPEPQTAIICLKDQLKKGTEVGGARMLHAVQTL